MLFRPKEYIIMYSILFRPEYWVRFPAHRNMCRRSMAVFRVNRRRKFAGSMWKKPEVLDRKSGTDKRCESVSNANLI